MGAEASAINGVKNVIILSNKNISKNITAEDFSHTVISSGSLSGEINFPYLSSLNSFHLILPLLSILSSLI